MSRDDAEAALNQVKEFDGRSIHVQYSLPKASKKGKKDGKGHDQKVSKPDDTEKDTLSEKRGEVFPFLFFLFFFFFFFVLFFSCFSKNTIDDNPRFRKCLEEKG